MPEFRVGNVVSLTSGGLPMTVTSGNEEYEQVTVAWLAADGTMQVAQLPTNALKRATITEMDNGR